MATSLQFPRSSRSLALIVAVSVGAVVLTGCTPGAESTSSATATPKPTSSETSEPTSTPSETTPASDAPVVSQPIDASCGDLVSADDIYNYNPNFTLVEDAAPNPDTKPGQIAGMNGLTCQWVHNTSKDTVDIAVAKLSDDELTALKNLAITESTPVPTYGAPPIEGYFTVIDSQGEAQIFTGSYWIAARSTTFFEPGDVEELAEAVMQNLPA
ncbi:iron ABC transporter ATP-binding protein [Mycetocola zhujimingii]|uniref:iron ABC transporter ATP-binding protein n=1 Tax=Mycetocola zhujimingii TaxID=2079792 RepID=UPI0013C496C9|nr:iron ABC transporter ATP-binding protein [Mycetocola zhujimingii]